VTCMVVRLSYPKRCPVCGSTSYENRITGTARDIRRLPGATERTGNAVCDTVIAPDADLNTRIHVYGHLERLAEGGVKGRDMTLAHMAFAT